MLGPVPLSAPSFENRAVTSGWADAPMGGKEGGDSHAQSMNAPQVRLFKQIETTGY